MTTTNHRFPLLPLRDIIVFPQMLATLFVGRSKSVAALEEAIKSCNGQIILAAQKESIIDEPDSKDLYDVGTLGKIVEMVNLPDGTIKVLIEGKERVLVDRIEKESKDSFMWADSFLITSHFPSQDVLYVLDKMLIGDFEQYAKHNKKITSEFITNLFTLDDIEKVIDTIAMQIPISISERQELLAEVRIKERIELILFFLKREIQSLETEEKIRDRIKSQMGQNHREYYLQEQLKAIQKELHSEDGKDDLGLWEKKIDETPLSPEAKKKASDELRKLRSMNPISAEASVIRNYLDWLLDIPWGKPSKKKFTIESAEKTLNKDHYGLEKVKDRILEFLSVQQRFAQPKGQIICLVGPPGVGKTSLAKSIARVTQRPYVRVALGGVRDEAEIRGHRRTYIGAMPGKIIQSLKKAKATNPLFLLDEIDKMGTDWRGDPASALLEVLDPEQNKNFNDHYLEVDYDLSNVMFLATANTLNLPPPLLDRMEIIRIAGYTEEEKIHIAMNHLMNKQLEENGLKKNELKISRDAMRDMIRFYTREAGVRGLERTIASLCRKSVRKLLSKETKKIEITAKDLPNYLGPQKFQLEKPESAPQIGVTTGLAWTEVGGDILYIEAVKSEGKGKINITGKLGEVMQESAHASLSYIKSKASQFGIDPSIFAKTDIHLHVPEGATPKDGPSAGIAITTALLSLLTDIAVKSTVAMTGEITLRGRVLGIGGLKEKLLAAQYSGIKTVLIPQENEKDLVEIPDIVKKSLEIIPVSSFDQVIKEALISIPYPLIASQDKTSTPTINTPYPATQSSPLNTPIFPN